MKLAMEIPTAYLSEFSPLCDIDFALAQEVLNDVNYANFYKKQREAGRYVILDNGFHELGHPLSPAELEDAADRIQPSVVIAPDWLGKPVETLGGFNATWDRLHTRYRIGAVICGTSPTEREQFFLDVYKRASLLCLPFKEPRLRWFQELLSTFKGYEWPPRIHLLGVNELSELRAFKNVLFEERIPESLVSVDTAKPVKWGILGKRFDVKLNLRGATLASSDIAKQEKLTPTQKQDIFYNTAFLRKFL